MTLSKEEHEHLHSILQLLNKSSERLKISYEHCKTMDITYWDTLSDEQSMPLEALASRFARTSDIFLKKLLKFLAKIELFDFQILRDLLHITEKKGWIRSTDIWIKIHEIRNSTAYDYSLTNFTELYQSILQFTPFLLEDIKKTKQYIHTTINID